MPPPPPPTHRNLGCDRRLPTPVTTRYTEIGHVKGIAYAKRFQRVDVMVLRKRE